MLPPDNGAHALRAACIVNVIMIFKKTKQNKTKTKTKRNKQTTTKYKQKKPDLKPIQRRFLFVGWLFCLFVC